MIKKYMVINYMGDVVAQGNNKREMIKVCNKQPARASVVKNDGERVYANADQRAYDSAPKYMVIINIGDIEAEGNNLRQMIKACNRQPVASWVETPEGEILHENKIQRMINNQR